LHTEFNNGIVTTEVQVAIQYPEAAIISEDVDLTQSSVGVLDAGGIFSETGRTVSDNTLTITYVNRTNLTAGELTQYKDTYLKDISFTLNDVVAYDTVGDHSVSVTLSGRTEIAFDTKTQVVTYSGGASHIVTCTESVPNAVRPSVKTYMVSFYTNGGTAIDSLQVKSGSVITAPATTREEYVFAGWYADAAFSKLFDFATPITSHTTLYAKWIAKTSDSTITLVIGDETANVYGNEVENDVAPKIVNGRTMLPIRFVAEALGATVLWDEAARAVSIRLGEKNIQLIVGEAKAIVDGNEVALDVASFIENDRTYLPLRFVAENLGAVVEWEEATQTVTIIGGRPNTIILTIGKKEAVVFGMQGMNDVAPQLVNDRTMLPIRFVAEALGATVLWDEKAQTVSITLDEIDIRLTIGEAKAMVNGNEVALDVASFIENSRTYLPLRFVAENLGATVEWMEDIQTVVITKK